MTQIQHNLRNQELQELNYKLPYLLFSSGVIKYMETFNIYEKLPIPRNKCFIGQKTGTIVNTGKEPAYFQESISGIKYLFWNYEFELSTKPQK